MEKITFVLVALLLASFFLHFWGLEYPSEVVFDEVHFGKLAGFYFSGNYSFDIHPPLGKLIIAAGGYLTGFNPGFTFETIGLKYLDSSYYGMRFFPALLGSLLPLIIYLVIRKLGGSRKIGILGMILLIFENSLLVQSRIILFDIFILFFGLCGFLFYLYSREQKNRSRKFTYLIISGLFLGASFTVKLTGLVFWFLVFLLSLISLLRHLDHSRTKIKPTLIFIFSLIVIPIAFYISIFAIHFPLLPYSGVGDAFMSQRFQSTLINNVNYKPDVQMGFVEKFAELNKEMLAANSRITANHSYSIKWYEMPIMGRPIYYWNKADGNTMARIYLLGNVFVWWLVLVGMFCLIGIMVFSFVKRRRIYFLKREFIIVLTAGYLLNWLIFAFMSRAIFLYHYFPSLVLGIILFCLVFEKRLVNKKSRSRYFYWVIIGFVIFGFLFFSPLTYGWQLDENTYSLLAWFSSWR